MGGSSSTHRVSAPGGSKEQRLQARERWNEAMASIQRGELPSIDLASQGLDPKAVDELCEALAGDEVVKAIELDGNRVGDVGSGHLGKILAANSAIRFLDLTRNGIRDAGAKALASGLGGNSALYHLDLTRNRITSAGADALGKMLCANGTMRQLALSENKVGHDGVRAIGLAVKAHPSLRILNLRRCGLGAEGSRLLAEGLDHESATLTELSVGRNNIQDSGAKAFANVVKANKSLRELYMDDNSITDSGGIAMAESLRHNDVLQTLWMVRNDLATETVAKFGDAINQNSTLRRLGITSKRAMPPHIVEAWQAARSRRHGDGRAGEGQREALPKLPPPGFFKEKPVAPTVGGGQGAPSTSGGASRAREDGGPDDDGDDDDGVEFDEFADDADGIDEFADGAVGHRPATSRAQREGASGSRMEQAVQEIRLMDDQLEFELQREATNQSIRRAAPVDLGV